MVMVMLHVDLAPVETRAGRYGLRDLKCPACARWSRTLVILGPGCLACRRCLRTDARQGDER